MKNIILMAGFAISVALPASASTFSVKYTPESGDAITVHYDDETMTMSWGDNSSPYTFDVDAAKVCGELPDGKEICVTFETVGNTVGHVTAYETSDGVKGTAEVIAASDQ